MKMLQYFAIPLLAIWHCKAFIHVLARRLKWKSHRLFENVYTLINETIHSPDFIRQHRTQDTAFTRDRTLTFPQLMLHFLNFPKRSLQQELDNVFHVLSDEKWPRQVVTKSALVQARRKFSASAFIALNRLAITQFYQHATVERWHGYRVCAVDGTKLRLPNTPEIGEAFGLHNGRLSQKDCPMALASIYYDVLNQIVIDARLEKVHTPERDCAFEHLDHTDANDLVLYDRGYPAFRLFSALMVRAQPFCMRMKTKLDLTTRNFLKSRKREAIIEVEPSKRAFEQCEQRGLPLAPLRLRLIRVKLKKETEVLITNLTDQDKFPASVFKELYHLRWGIEENHKRQKQWLEIENFSGKSAQCVEQDFHAKIVSLNLAAIMVHASREQVARNTDGRKLRYQINFAQALSKMKNTLVQLIVALNPREQISHMLDYLTDTLEAVIPLRSFPRNVSNLHHNISHLCYKRCK